MFHDPRGLTTFSRLYRKKKAGVKMSGLASTTRTPEPQASASVAHVYLKQAIYRAFNHHAIVHCFWQVL